MSTLNISSTEIREEYKLLGNRGLVAQIAYDEIDPKCHPLGPNNKLILTTSPLEGFNITSTGRISVGGKSPLTGGIKESNSGGVAAQRLIDNGIRVVIIEGVPKKNKFYILHIKKDGAELKSAEHIAGMGTYAVAEKIYEEYGKDVGLLTIGPAGERRMSAAGICINDMDGDPSRLSARGGMAAVMGAKYLKAVVIDKGDYQPAVYDNNALKEARKNFHKKILSEPAITEGYKKYGTMGQLVNLSNVGGLPSYGFRRGTFDKAEQISGQRMYELITERGGEGKTTHGCMPGCIIQCSNVYPDKNGKKIVAPIEYEMAALLGANLGIDDLDRLAHLNWLCNDYGLDVMEVGVALGIIADAGLLEFGDADRVEELIKEIGEGTYLGRILGAGCVVTGKVFGQVRVPATKGQAMAAHEPRGMKGMSITYAMSTMGADHTVGATYRLPVDHKSAEGHLEATRKLHVIMAWYDNLMCMFVSRGLGGQNDLVTNLINAIYGTSYDPEYLFELGKKTIKLERAFNISAGLIEESVPEFMKYEELEDYGVVSDIPQSDYDRYWDESFWGEFPEVKR